jgi:membrane-bound metal-dependent hydrolase YbcI (DUF457 family)
MQTYSHFFMTALVKAKLNKEQLPVHGKAFLLGSFMPDVPLILCSLWFMAYYRWLHPPTDGDPFGVMYDNYYFNHPLWITGHSLMHSPPMLALWFTLGYYFGFRRDHAWGRSLCWFITGCAFHATVDIMTHFNDGPLLFYPFDWHYRFSSPVSYYNSQHYGHIFAPLEHLLDLGIIAYFITRNQWVQRQMNRLIAMKTVNTSLENIN